MPPDAKPTTGPDPAAEDGRSDDAVSASDSAFALLDEGLQRQLWRMRWDSLRPIQVDAIRAVLETDADIVIAAETAGGKTEAAFLPILSRIAAEPTGSVRALYVGPLKALINDQFARLEELCRYVEIPVHRWHGDVGANRKSKLLEAPGGVLLITPESLESLFVNRTTELPRLFGGLRFVVIDELHAFLSASRGLHLQSLLRRLAGRTGGPTPEPPRLVGLSATIGDLEAAQRFLDPDAPGSVCIIEDEDGGSEVRYRVHAYSEPVSEEDDDDEARADTRRRMARDIFDHCQGHTNLVFANARRDVEIFGDLCNGIAAAEGFRDAFPVHHGSLSREIRFDAEAIMKSGRPVTTICSSTLELGIDIGSVRAVGQIGAPWSVASLKQRLGRSGRTAGEPRIMRVYLRLAPPDDPDPLRRLQLPLVRTVAVTGLMIEHWSEPDHLPRCDLSTLTQQVISVIAETGGVRADALYDTLCRGGAFRGTDERLFAQLLRQLGAKDVVEQMAGGDLILGLAGERIRAQRDFYAVFETPLEYHVVADGRPLGSLPLIGIPSEQDHLILAGRRWEVIAVDHDRHELRVTPGHGRKPPLFGGGIGDIHPKIVERMQSVLTATDEPAYLDTEARAALARARAEYERLSDGGRSRFVGLGRTKTIWFTWAGSRAQLTLAAALRCAGVDARDAEIAFELPGTVGDAQAIVRSLAAALADPEAVAAAVAPKAFRKYDHLLDEDLLTRAVLQDRLDFDTAWGARGVRA
jgi:ATP-dependent Lhr-like helicase